MSAQIIAALQARAAELDTEAVKLERPAHRKLDSGTATPIEHDQATEALHLASFKRKLAEEFRELADAAEGRTKPPFDQMKSQSQMWNEAHPDDPVEGVEYRKMTGAVYRTRKGRQLSQIEFEQELGL